MNTKILIICNKKLKELVGNKYKSNNKRTGIELDGKQDILIDIIAQFVILTKLSNKMQA